jgi:PAS domain S-box-containing protein
MAEALQTRHAEVKRAEEALRESEMHLRLLLETTSAIPWQASAESWQFTYVGPQAARIMGYPVDEWYQKDFWIDHIHPEDRKYAIDFCHNSSSRLRDYEFEYRMIRPDGSIVWLHDIVNVESMNGVPKTLRGFMIDITERKLEAKQIQLKSEELSILHDLNQAVSSTLDLKNVLNLLVEKTAQLLPYSSAFISLYNQSKGELETIVSRNLHIGELRESMRRIGGKSFAQRIFETKTPMVSKHLQEDPRVRDPEFARRHGLKSYAGMPLVVQEKSLGVLGFYTKEEHDFSGEEVEFLSTLASQAAIAIHNSQLYANINEKTAELQKANQQLSALYSVSRTISNSLETDFALSSGMRKVQEILDFESARLYLFDEKEGELRLLANEGSPDGFVPSSSIKPGKGALGKVFGEGRLIYFEDIQTDPNYLQLTPSGKALKAGFRGSLSIPIKAKNKVTGVMNFSSKSPHRFTAAEVQLIESIANNFGTVIENLYLFQKIRSRSEELQKSGEELRRLTGNLLSAQEDERRRLARELHDDLTQRLAVLAIEAGKMEQQFDTSPDLIRERLPAMKDQIVALSTDIHRISRQLHPSILDDLGLVDAIKSLCTGFSKQEDILVEFTPENLPEILPKDLSLCLYRITQEVLRNIAKHAHAKEAHVTLAGNNGSVILSIRDSGVGFDLAQARRKPGLGLASMEERVRLIHGSLSVQSEPARGTTIEVRAPLARREYDTETRPVG